MGSCGFVLHKEVRDKEENEFSGFLVIISHDILVIHRIVGMRLSADGPLQADGQKEGDPHQCEPPFVWGYSSPSYGVTSSTL